MFYLFWTNQLLEASSIAATFGVVFPAILRIPKQKKGMHSLRYSWARYHSSSAKERWELAERSWALDFLRDQQKHRDRHHFMGIIKDKDINHIEWANALVPPTPFPFEFL